MTSEDAQLGFDFEHPVSPEGGYTRWQQERRETLEAMARQLGLPLGRRVEVILRDGACLRGALALASDELWIQTKRDLRLELRIERCTFEAREIESCVRLD